MLQRQVMKQGSELILISKAAYWQMEGMLLWFLLNGTDRLTRLTRFLTTTMTNIPTGFEPKEREHSHPFLHVSKNTAQHQEDGHRPTPKNLHC
jgi:hypothetical protein